MRDRGGGRGGSETDRQTETGTEGQTDRQTNRDKHRHTDSQREVHTLTSTHMINGFLYIW